MGLRDFLRLSALLKRSGKVPDQPLVDKRFTERQAQVSPGGMVYDLFEPRRPSEGLVVPLHGSTLNGKDDPRLQHFARCVALSGATCAVPTLPGMADMQWLSSDVDGLVELLEHLHEQTGRRPGMIGFSFAGSYALLAAARAQVAHKVRFVLGLGAYHSLNRVYDSFLERQNTVPRTPTEWDDRIYLHLTIAHRWGSELNLDPELQRGVTELLKGYCNRAGPDEKRAFFEKHLRQLDLINLDGRLHDKDMFDAVSPAGQMGDLRCQVGLIHDPHDGIVPVEHAQALFTDLERGPVQGQHRLLITSLLNHVNLSGALNMPEIYRMFKILQPLVQGERQTERGGS